MTNSVGFQMATTIDRSKIKENGQVFGGQVFKTVWAVTPDKYRLEIPQKTVHLKLNKLRLKKPILPIVHRTKICL